MKGFVIALVCALVVVPSANAQLREPAPPSPLLAPPEALIELPSIQPETDVDAPPASEPLRLAKRRSWLAAEPEKDAESSEGTDFSWGSLVALSVILAVAGTSLFFNQRRRRLSASANATGQLSVLSTCRIGPKAHAVSLQAEGRVYLLGVTEQSVCQLATLSEAKATPMSVAEQLAAGPPVQSLPAAEDEDIEEPEELASSDQLQRFQALLRSSLSAPDTRARVPRDAASRLATSLRDVVSTTAAESQAMSTPPPPQSLRRSRRRRQSELNTVKQTAVAPQAEVENFEGQVAGLRNLRSG